jgi:hypothetical protein
MWPRGRTVTRESVVNGNWTKYSTTHATTNSTRQMQKKKAKKVILGKAVKTNLHK